MRTPDKKYDSQSAMSLLESHITTVKVDRRSFLVRTGSAGTLAFGTALLAGCGEGDECDSDVTTDTDSGPNADIQDSCDTDR